MKSVILLLLMANTNVIAFEQIFAINGGGEAHTDSDGIVYRGREEKNKKFDRFPGKNIGNVPEWDEEIYHSCEFSMLDTFPPLRYDVPLKTDGFYLLIAKFLIGGTTQGNYMTLNNDIQMLSNVVLNQLCEHFDACDKYFYFCVTDNILHYQNQSTLVQNNEIHIEFKSLTAFTFVSGLVLLRV
jgi:hypothetical protein